ncbi:MAG: serine--tRNA ligase [Bacteroidetes bacterium]|nr:serine--tRNA ligase [Bacteroidota bacterium]
MIQLQNIRQNPEEVIQRLSIRGIDAAETVSQIVTKDKQARENRTRMESLQARSNQLAREVGELMKSGKREEAEPLKQESVQIKEELKGLQDSVESLETEVRELVVSLPNTPSTTVPTGKSAEDNVTVTTWGKEPELHEGALPHWDLATKYDIIDFELGVKITGAGFPVYKGKGAKLQRALIQFFLNEASNAGYLEVQVPHMVNADSGFGTGQLPDKEGQMYYMPLDDLYMIPTAEVPVTNFFRDVILEESQLPVKTTGYTPCFRREAGSYGAHVRGLNRLHQFDKVEIVQIVHPETSYQVLEDMHAYVQGLLQKLGLHYRLLLLCGGDMGMASAKTYDLEVWSGAQQRWLECSSVSNFETFQTHRLKCRFRNKEGKTELAHSLNGSALALPRIVAAILENYQTPEGIVVPEVLRPYCGFDLIN